MVCLFYLKEWEEKTTPIYKSGQVRSGRAAAPRFSTAFFIKAVQNCHLGDSTASKTVSDSHGQLKAQWEKVLTTGFILE